MPISSTTRKTSPFTGNGSLTALPFAFKVFATSDVEVIRTTISTGAKTTLVLSTDYTVALNGNQDTAPGGTVTLNTALATGYTAIVVSKIPQTQPTSLSNAGGFFPNVIQAAFDRAIALVQQVQERLNRTPSLPVNDTSSWPEIPVAASRTNTVLGFNASGVPSLIPKTDFVGPSGPAGPTGPAGPAGPPGAGGASGDGLALTGGTMTGDIVMDADADGGIQFRRSSDSSVQGRIGRNNDALAVTAIGTTIPLQLGANGSVRMTVQPNGAVTLAPLASEPSGPVEGSTYYDSTAKALRVYTGSGWRTLAMDSGTTSPDGPLSVSTVTVSGVTTTTATVSTLIAGETPAGSLMLLQITTNLDGGTWLESDTPTDAEAGAFSFEFTGLTAGTTYYARASVYTEVGGGLPSIVHAVTGITAFATDASEGLATPSYSQMLTEIEEPSDGRAYAWIAYVNDPSAVPFTGGGAATEATPAVNSMGALARGTTMPAWAIADGSIPSGYKDSDIWPIYTPWMICAEETSLASLTSRQHSASNVALYSGRAQFWVWRNSLGQWVKVRDRADQQYWFNATENYLIYDSGVSSADIREPLSTEGDGEGIVIKWNNASGFARHGAAVAGPEAGFVLSPNAVGIDLSAIASDIGAVAVTNRLGLVPWDPNTSVTWANAKIVTHIGCDVRAEDPHTGMIPGVMLSKQWRLSSTIRFYSMISLRNTIFQDRSDKASGTLVNSAEAGFTLAEATARPIPGWAT